MNAIERRERINTLKNEMWELLRSCPHSERERKHESVYCIGCGKCFGWACPDAPNDYCEYPDGEENCRYCGDPEERK